MSDLLREIKSGFNTNTQFGRVCYVTAGTEWLTLRDIEKRIGRLFKDKDTQAAISARLREVSPIKHGFVKERRHEQINGKRVYFYRLVPFVQEAA
ncbi:hypothetical protein TW81_02145 [Vibrio galatheae]|uniref:Uncharacterized protein n=1 Tax=Vibrio galatheae TaxID=579748 RepID=A0A0F4NNX7_9VIBR|nr:hypothetical protein [Vibrio galatheae]KJY84817.1 hypothetical protein TW81_02145 [Vibrio galatheae]